MKFLADVNVEKQVVQDLRKSGYDVKWITEENPYLEDIEILSIANNENRILITCEGFW